MADETQKTLDAILNALQKLDERVARIESGATPTPVATPSAAGKVPRKTSIKEFLLEHRPEDDVQRTLAIGYFLETSEGMSSFNKADLEKGYRLAKEQLPSNINDKVNMSIKNGHLMEAEEKKESMKAWVVTSTGEQYIQSKFVKEARRK